MCRRGTRRGFTLVELCCVVGIVAILSSLGTTSYITYVRRARATEAVVNVEALAYLEQVRILELGAPIACPKEPRDLPREDAPLFFNAAGCWKDLGFRPSAPVRFQYETEALGGRRFVVRARGDLDGDGTASEYAIDSATMTLSRANAD